MTLAAMKLLSVVLVTFAIAAVGLSAAYAQSSASIRVSNLEQHVGTAISVHGNQQWAQSFCTGGSASTLTKVRMYTALVDWTSGPTPDTGDGALPVVTIRSDDSGIPGTVLHTLSNPILDTNLDTAEDFTSSGYALLPSTRYWLTVERPESSSLIHFLISETPSTDEDSSTEPGWAIGDRALANLTGSWRGIWPINMRMAVFAGGDAPFSMSPVSPDHDCAGATDPFQLPLLPEALGVTVSGSGN